MVLSRELWVSMVITEQRNAVNSEGLAFVTHSHSSYAPSAINSTMYSARAHTHTHTHHHHSKTHSFTRSYTLTHPFKNTFIHPFEHIRSPIQTHSYSHSSRPRKGTASCSGQLGRGVLLEDTLALSYGGARGSNQQPFGCQAVCSGCSARLTSGCWFEADRGRVRTLTM